MAALRPVVAMIVIASGAAVTVAPAMDMAAQQRATSHAASGGATPLANDPHQTPQPDEDPDADPSEAPMLDFETLLHDCVESADPDSDECAAAALESGMSYEEFRAKIVAKLQPEPTRKPEPTKKPEPVVTKKPEPQKTTSEVAKVAAKDSGDFWAWFEKCLITRNLKSDTCVRAQQLIGFNDADFRAKFERYLAERDAKAAKATPAPTTVAPTLEMLFKACGESRVRDSLACSKALGASGLQPSEFWAKIQARFGFH